MAINSYINLHILLYMEEGNAEITPVDKEVLSTWLANNHEEYAEFKEMCHALATETDITKISKTFDVDIESLINLLTVFMCLQEENMTINELYTEAIAENDDFLCALCCFLYFDDGLEQAFKSIEIRKDVLRRLGMLEMVESIVEQKEVEEKEELSTIEKDLNLLALRRWHYDHPQKYAEFLDSVDRAADGDMTFATKGFNSLMDILSLGGVKDMMALISCFVPGTDGYTKSMVSSGNLSFHDRLGSILDSSLNNEATRQKIQSNNPHFNSTLYWLAFDNGFSNAVEIISKNLLSDGNLGFIKTLGIEAIQSLVYASFEKAGYTKGQWKNIEKGPTKKIVASALMDLKGRRGRRDTCLLLEEMICPEYRDQIIMEMDKIIAEDKQFNDTDSIFAYIFAALDKCQLLNDKYSYRSYHNALREKFPQYVIKMGFDHAEALYHALTNRKDYNISITGKQIKQAEKHVRDIVVRFRMLMSPDIIQ